MEFERREDMIPEYLRAEGKALDAAFLEWQEKQALLHGLMNKTLDTAIDTNQKMYGNS
ncbi:MAG: hypothetical protein ACP5N7_00470 [Candidatus Pacearchaeota archaeon]